MAALSAFYPYIVPMCPGVSEPMVDQMLISSAIEFCGETNILQRVQTATVNAGTANYAITEPPDLQLATILEVAYLNRPLTPVAAEDVTLPTALRGAVGTESAPSGDPALFYQRIPTEAQVYLFPVPANTSPLALTIKASFMPTRAATTLDDRLYNVYWRYIAMGAVARLASQPSQSYSNPHLAKTADDEYTQGLNSAKRDARIGLIQTSQRVKPRRFA